MTGILLLGFLIGMKHAMEADHVAAVAALATRTSQLATIVRQGTFWGVGHTLTLFLFGGLVLLSNQLIPDRVAGYLELAVGFMLVALGIDVLIRLFRNRTAGLKAGEAGHESDRRHSLRALLVGMMHGMAGSAALILLVLQSVDSTTQGLAYIALFGAGSILGMTLLAFGIALPMRYSARSAVALHSTLHLAVGCGTLVLGSTLVYQLGIAEGLLI